jgi:transposase
MSTSLLYHAFGIRGYQHVSTHYQNGEVVFQIRQRKTDLLCPRCAARRIIRKGTVEREFSCVPIGSKPVSVVLAVQRVLCLVCDTLRQVKVKFADPQRSYTRQFERYALDLSRHMTIKSVAQHLRVSWDVIKDIQKRNLSRRFGKPKLKRLRQIAIDEISIGKGHRYLTIVLDLRTGAVVFVGEGKGADALVPFWRRLKASRARVQAVAIDMSPAYIQAVSNNLPKATIVFDRFHIVKLFNDKLSDFRRALYREAFTDGEKNVIKGTRWLLLKNPENLDETRDEPRRLQKALELNKPLATAYYMKEDLRQLWAQPNKAKAWEFLIDWVYRAGSSGVSMLRKFAKTLAVHWKGILAFYDYPISTGPLEGTNNKIKTMKRQAYGFRDQDFFKLKIMTVHLTRYALIG